jgi:hypothetical protein
MALAWPIVGFGCEPGLRGECASAPAGPGAPLRPLAAGVSDTALLCPGAEHTYRIEPLSAGTLFGVELTASGEGGEVDMVLTSTLTGAVIRGVSRVFGRPLALGLPADGGPYVLTVRSLEGALGGGASVQRYEVVLSVLPEPTNDCCSPGVAPGSGVSRPGCQDDAVLLCVCELDSFCCTGGYDALCVTEAVGGCGLVCGMPGCSSAGGSSPAQGCGDEAVKHCVCDIDPYCCGVHFDDNCSRLAQHRCGGSLSSGP